MAFRHNLGEATQSIAANIQRSLLTMLGIIVGVAALITMASVGAGAQLRISEQIASIGANVLMMLPGAARGASNANGNLVRTVRLTVDDASALADGVPEIAAAAPSIQTQAQLVFGNRNRSSRINGTTAEYFNIRDWPLAAGRTFSRREESAAGKVVVIGHSLKEWLFEDDDPIGREIRIRSTPMTVIGVLAEKGQSGNGRDQDDIAFVPFKTAQLRLGATGGRATPDGVSYILAKAVDDDVIERAKIGAALLLRQRHRVAQGAIAGFRVSDPAAAMQTQQEASRTVGWLLAAIASVSLVVGGISIMNIMLVSVTERTREIGLRMALGATRRDISRLFLMEAVLICLAGGALGIAASVSASWLVAMLAGWPVFIAPSTVVAALVFAAAVGIVFGYYPARRAANLLPAAALSHA